MSIKGADEAIDLLKKWEEVLKRMGSMTPKVIMSDSVRVGATPSQQLKERGTVKDRLAQTDAEAEAIAGADAARLGTDATVPEGLTAEQEEALDDAVIDRMVDDIIERTILKGM